MGKDEGREFLFIGEKMTAMDVRDRDLVLPPLGFAKGGERKKTVNCGRKSSGGSYAPLVLFDDNGSAGLNEVVVGKDQEVSECCGTCPCPHSGGNEVFQWSVKSEGREQVLFLHSEAGYVVQMFKHVCVYKCECCVMKRWDTVRGSKLTMVSYFLSHQLPGFLQMLKHLLEPLSDVLCMQLKNKTK